MAVLGVDAYQGHWIGALFGEDRAWITAHTRRRIAELVNALAGSATARTGPIRVLATDIPIRLPETGRRPVDELASTVDNASLHETELTTPGAHVSTSLTGSSRSATSCVPINRLGARGMAWPARCSGLTADGVQRRGIGGVDTAAGVARAALAAM